MFEVNLILIFQLVKQMTFKQHIKSTISLAVPVAIGQLGHVMLGVVDTLMVGRLGAVQLAASSLVNSLLILILIFGMGMSVAVTPLVAISKGSDDNKECGLIHNQALIVNFIFSLILCGFSIIASEFIGYLNQPTEVILYAKSYMKIMSFSMIPLMIFLTYKQFFDGLSITKPGMFVAIISNLINVIGNYILIFGKFGFPALGLDGAGIASFSTRLFMAILIIFYFYRSKKFKQYSSIKFTFRIDKKIAKKIFITGLPTGFQMFFEVGAFSFAAVMIGWLGANQLAAHQIAISMASVTFMIVLGISSAATIRVGNFLGQKNLEHVRKAIYASILLGVSLMAFFGLTFIIFNKELPTLFITNRKVIEYSSTLLIIAAFFQIFDGTQAVSLGVLRGLIDVKIPMYLAFISYWIISIPLSYLLGFVFNFGVSGVWVSLSIGLIFAAMFFVFRINWNINQIQKGLETK